MGIRLVGIVDIRKSIVDSLTTDATVSTFMSDKWIIAHQQFAASVVTGITVVIVGLMTLFGIWLKGKIDEGIRKRNIIDAEKVRVRAIRELALASLKERTQVMMLCTMQMFEARTHMSQSSASIRWATNDKLITSSIENFYRRQDDFLDTRKRHTDAVAAVQGALSPFDLFFGKDAEYEKLKTAFFEADFTFEDLFKDAKDLVDVSEIGKTIDDYIDRKKKSNSFIPAATKLEEYILTHQSRWMV